MYVFSLHLDGWNDFKRKQQFDDENVDEISPTFGKFSFLFFFFPLHLITSDFSFATLQIIFFEKTTRERTLSMGIEVTGSPVGLNSLSAVLLQYCSTTSWKSSTGELLLHPLHYNNHHFLYSLVRKIAPYMWEKPPLEHRYARVITVNLMTG